MTQDAQADRIAALGAELAALRADNARLRRLLDARSASGELRHRQRNTFAMLRMLIRASSEAAGDLEAYVSHLEDRLDAVARVQAAIDVSGHVELADLIASELLAYTVREGEQATLAGPAVRLQPQAAQVLALAVHELAINAIEHGCLARPSGCLDVRWSHDAAGDGAPLTFVWKETGDRGLAAPVRRGFGTEVLTETLAYELKAVAALSYEPDGLRCTIRFPLPERIGSVLADDAPA
ncbi:HWE histidine kinase domain-containing protein [Methylobacterium radiodurans]|uniref:histidine kinase n=1 Tax=Methylobacterium radiodurans TaxID=2202828 RepID=A0A2U8VTY4_9HYPH|nr:HWE histidine kinase domain-containing protein [Methylobacterium radiodurans]AWN37177.1 histidine kinase [Methylobacterium radiodurans]